jgi:hypothetical protein
MRARLQGSAPEGGRRGATPRTVGATAVVVFLLLAFTAGSRWQANPVDQEIAQGAHRLAIDQGWIASAARLATFLGSTTCLIVVVAGSWAALWIMRMRSAAAFVVLTSGARRSTAARERIRIPLGARNQQHSRVRHPDAARCKQDGLRLKSALGRTACRSVGGRDQHEQSAPGGPLGQ